MVEKAAEAMRQVASRNPLFNPNEAFAACDVTGNGLVTKSELRLFLEMRGIFCQDQEVEAIARRWDKNGDGIITHAEF